MSRDSVVLNWMRHIVRVIVIIGVAMAFDSTNPAKADEGALPSFNGALGWLNSAPLTRESVRGKVVLVDFWTYTCINSLRNLPYIKAWAEKYKAAGLVLIGVHTPEFSFEGERPNVEMAIRNYKVGRRNRAQKPVSGGSKTPGVSRIGVTIGVIHWPRR